ncbi:PAS domain S-box-containing protein [Actinoplanes tereljensis]|uniref:Chemotaxis protein n=1 Tax=Paractinoplanes tereljensis TaxID=571912 RepID=A0A919NHG8_9ACTN|nr:PAS domain-containing protein [Actinoplanes tereljensis]GIF18715.1 chemotaxis protein [Actinoplanes tereljensis]
MRGIRTLPTGVERTFGADEIIVTKTDPRGVLTYANDVFLRLSACTEEEALGQPHNLIRHPDMPRAVFKLLWDTLGRREEIFAYVLNLALDGAHYWVFAHVTPSFDRAGKLVGYHSNRRRPDPESVLAVKQVYDRILHTERGRPTKGAAVDSGWKQLQEELDGQTYDEFVWTITNRIGR